jgi:hypothetical protein
MTVEPHNTLNQLQRLYRTQSNARLARRIQGVYLTKKGLTCPQIMKITSCARRTIQQFSTARPFVESSSESLVSCIPGRDYTISCTAWAILAFVRVLNMSKPTGKPKRLSKKVPPNTGSNHPEAHGQDH